MKMKANAPDFTHLMTCPKCVRLAGWWLRIKVAYMTSPTSLGILAVLADCRWPLAVTWREQLFKLKILVGLSGLTLSQQVFWKVYTQHNRGHIGHYMSRYKIGEVSPEDMAIITARTFYDESFYENNPEPYPDLLINTRYPYNAEGRLRDFTNSWVTPIGKHFVRNHCHVPDIDPKVRSKSCHSAEILCLHDSLLNCFIGGHFTWPTI